MGKIMLNGKQYGVGGIEKAKDISYDNTQSGMSATNVQGAVDELKSGLTTVSGEIINARITTSQTYSLGTWYSDPFNLPAPSMERATLLYNDITTGSNGIVHKARDGRVRFVGLTSSEVIGTGDILCVSGVIVP